MQKTKAKAESKRMRPAMTPEARENQLISLAVDLAEKQLREGTASSQVITQILKNASSKARLENEMLEMQKELIAAKTESLRSAQKMEELFAEAINAFKGYSGQEDEQDEY